MEIEDGIDIPKSRAKGLVGVLLKMSIGQSVFLDGGNSQAQGAIWRARKLDDSAKFTTRKNAKNGKDGIRIWRIE